jgi:hypothetical protein
MITVDINLTLLLLPVVSMLLPPIEVIWVDVVIGVVALEISVLVDSTTIIEDLFSDIPWMLSSFEILSMKSASS